MIKKALVLGIIFGAFAVNAIAQTYSSVSVQGSLRACDESQLNAAMAQRGQRISVPVGVKRTVSLGQPVAILTGDAVEVQVTTPVYTQKDQRGLFGMRDSLLIAAGDRCDAAAFRMGGEQFLRLGCTGVGTNLHNVYFMSATGQFCNVSYHVNQYTHDLMRQEVSSVAETPNAMAVYHTNVKTVVVFIDGSDGRLRFEARRIAPDGTITETKPYEFDAASVAGGGPIALGPLSLQVIGSTFSSLTYQIMPAQPGV